MGIMYWLSYMSPYYVLETALHTSAPLFQHLHFSHEETEVLPQSFREAVTQVARGKSLSLAKPSSCCSLVPPKGHTKTKTVTQSRPGPTQPASLILCKRQWRSECSPLTIDTAKLISGPPTPRPLLLRVFTGLLTAATEMPTCISHH